MSRAALAGAATLLLVLVAAFPMTTGSAPIRSQVVSASPQVATAVLKAPESPPSVTATVAPQKVPAAARDSMSPVTTKPSATIQPTAAPVVRSSPLVVDGSGTSNSGVARWVRSTSYCEQGRMANGEYTYWGAVAMAEPFGSRWLVLSGPLAGRTFTVGDRYSWGTQFDVAMPGECGRAREYGLRVIQVQRVG
jgi:hypothetical protein